MRNVILITGGQRSGKSSYGQKLAEKKSSHPVYLATARTWDEDFENRIKRHRSDRGDQWETLEEEKHLGRLDLEGKTVLLDCVTLWLTNIFFDCEYDLEQTLELAKKEWSEFTRKNIDLIVVSNELGMGVHPEHEVARKFADLQGWINQYIASGADQVYFMVSGIPQKIK